ncbi:MAG: hypothetical protein D6786_00555 [Gammaproteobacteria bacterium]|nr:MAG: hypothetical protein D6786_00555 [Gammaproteobacteria bacterium]
MSQRPLLNPDTLRERLQTRCRRQRGAWLRGEGAWPVRLPLGLPGEEDALRYGDQVRRWIAAWSAWNGAGRVEWVERRWRRLGTQRLPGHLVLETPAEAMSLCGLEREWRRAADRLQQLRQRWPQLEALAARSWPVLAEWPEGEFERLLALLRWLQAHPDSGLLIRQLPVPGVDSKWLEEHRRIVGDWLAVLLGKKDEEADLHALAGLRRLPRRLRLRLLDSRLRQRLGGLDDIEAPVEELARLALPIERVFIVENLQTGLAFGDLPGAVVFMKQGFAVDLFADLPWLTSLPLFYWGDLDTNGLAILSRLRSHLPHARSLLMDEATLLAHRRLWSHEAHPARAAALPHLTRREAELYRALRENRWGPGTRLEQERIDWEYAWPRVAACGG